LGWNLLMRGYLCACLRARGRRWQRGLGRAALPSAEVAAPAELGRPRAPRHPPAAIVTLADSSHNILT